MRRHRTRQPGYLSLLGALTGLTVLTLLSDGGSGSGGDGGGDGGDDGTGASDGAGGSGSGTGDGAGGDDGKGAAKVEMTQAELDALIAKTHGKAKGQAEADLKKYLEAQGKTAEEQAKQAAKDADDRAKSATEKANGRLVKADAKVAAVTAGVKGERVDAVLKLADLSDVEVSDDGDVDPKAVKKAIDAVLKEYPEFKAGGSGKGGASGGEHNGNSGTKPKTMEDAVAARLAS